MHGHGAEREVGDSEEECDDDETPLRPLRLGWLKTLDGVVPIATKGRTVEIE